MGSVRVRAGGGRVGGAQGGGRGGGGGGGGEVAAGAHGALSSSAPSATCSRIRGACDKPDSTRLANSLGGLFPHLDASASDIDSLGKQRDGWINSRHAFVVFSAGNLSGLAYAFPASASDSPGVTTAVRSGTYGAVRSSAAACIHNPTAQTKSAACTSEWRCIVRHFSSPCLVPPHALPPTHRRRCMVYL